MNFQRGNPLDYERWGADPGMENGTSPIACRTSSAWRPASQRGRRVRGAVGPLKVERGPAATRCSAAFFEAAQQAGYALTDDVNGYRQEGFAAFDRNIYRGRRLSAARAYLHPARTRPQPRGAARAFVTRVVIEGGARSGSRWATGGRREAIRAGEVILSGGAINSPQLLQLSGVGDSSRAGPSASSRCTTCRGVGDEPPGPSGDLRPVRLHAAGVDAPALKMAESARVGREWLFLRKGPGRDQPLRGRRLHPQQRGGGLPEPDVPLPADRDALRRHRGRRPRLPGAHRADVLRRPRHVQDRPADPRSTRRSASTTSPPTRTAASGSRRSGSPAKILNQPAFEPFNGGELSPGPGVETDEQILDWVGRDAETALHPSCTAAMGDRPMVGRRPADDARARHSRGCGWSTPRRCPTSPTATSTRPVMMLAEKAADLILGNTPLPAEQVEFYRHQVDAGRRTTEPASNSTC